MKFNFKLVLIHLGFWCLHLMIWGLIDTAYAPSFWDTVDGNALGLIFFASGAYLNMYLLIPKLLLRRKIGLYVALVSLLILMISYSAGQFFGWYYQSIHADTGVFFKSVQGMSALGSEFLVVYGFSTCLYFINEWYIKERKLRELESQNLKAELDMLKGQINPHFLFNALNSVHVLIRTNPDLATETLEKFSDLLSHQLYDVAKDKIRLSQEVQNLDNFIQLQQMRHQDHIDVSWSFSGALEGKFVSPMLFLNFAENAFKHSAAEGEEQIRVEISLDLVGDQLTFKCVNSAVDVKNHQGRTGLGITNVRRRLDIIYPNRYELFTERDGNTYLVYFKLDLSED